MANAIDEIRKISDDANGTILARILAIGTLALLDVLAAVAFLLLTKAIAKQALAPKEPAPPAEVVASP